MANLTYEERVALEQQKEALRRQRDDERRNGVAGVRANDTRIAANDDAMHGRAGRKWLGGEAGAVSSGDALHGQAGRKWLGGGCQQTQEPQSRISFFASDGQGRISRGDNASGEMQVRDTDVWGNDWRLRMYADQMASHDEMGQVMQAVRQKKAQQQLGLQNDIASLMKYAQGGVIPDELRQLVNRKYGFDGVKSGLLPSSGFTQNGDFALQVANGVDRNGNVQVQTIGINPFQQYSMMQTNDAAFDDNDRAALRQRLKQSYGYSDRELAAVEKIRVPDLKKQYELRKLQLQNQLKEVQLAKALGQDSLDAAQKYALYHFKEFSAPQEHVATQKDVEAGLAKKVGEKFCTLTKPDQAFSAAVDFYKRRMKNQDPATNPPGGQQPAPGTEENPPAPGSEAQIPAAPAAGGEAAPAQTATPPAEGQGELGFGDGKQKRTYTVGEGDDIFSISIDKGVPIKQLRELNGWDENHVLKAGDSVILPDDAIADEPTFDEEEERKRRQAAKPKSNSWKNSSLFK